ncbi:MULTISPECIES: protease inhibitor I42 family protein [Pseudomonas]|jgi:inhibitor of cysteine peptidase|uniref:Protease inhibitor I42 family protein n=2 Tax=Pseudomonas TaxID=286 RepID=A0A9Q5B150_PSEFR|nr:protease inhibitor I42 family protein [Pseudomonas fragi]ARQ73595.1 peptidase inhibitor I42 [Pseudomonas fragi]MBM1199660.1 protease inhibitor I42 family protein [Pseudomonas fragi]MBM1206645.1 protease inhibitor I42 family protein [Pseudomonas fragi]MDE4513209.1 peptidase inhibitor I42 [Pseudomonas fragi]NNA85160.1 protease inhibitor I42 family protein [Pseudomonas fragi]
MPPVRLIPLLALSLLTACAQQPAHNVTLEDQSDCPQQLHVGQQLIVSLPSNPTTGYRWSIQDSAGGVLRSLGPEVYTSSDNGQLLGSGGQSTWRFQVFAPGSGRLRLTSQQPWEPEAEPAQVFDCPITVN